MGLVYSPSESEGLVNALRSNLKTAKGMIDDMNSASRNLVDSINGHTLSGAAYTAGKGLFQEMVIPTISKASETLEQLKSKLSQYESYAGAAGGELLDEDKLNHQLELLRAQQASLTSQINFYRMQSYIHPENSELNMMYANFQSQLSYYMSTTADDIQKVQDKLKRLHEFDSHVNGLFGDSLDEFKTILQIMAAITIDVAGNYTLKFNNNKDFKKFKDLAGSGGLPRSIAEAVVSQGTISKVMKQVGQAQRIKGIRLGGYSNSATSLSRAARRGKALMSIGDDLIEAGETVGKFKGLKVAGGIGTVLSVGLDYDEQMSKYNDVGRAVKNTGAHTGISGVGNVLGGALGISVGGYLAGSQIGATIGTFIPIPVVGTVAGAAIGAFIGWAGNEAYDWIESGQAAKHIGKFTKGVSKTVNNLKNEAGQVFAGFGKSLGSVFG